MVLNIIESNRPAVSPGGGGDGRRRVRLSPLRISKMYKTIVGIEGMACGMCEEHICSTIKKAFEVNKVKASRSKKCAEIITELPLDEKAVRDAIAPTGYEVTSFACVEEAPKKGFFAKLFG